jgi:tRNA threonylcarbamoyladenosine biosynthesis protein TsaE
MKEPVTTYTASSLDDLDKIARAFLKTFPVGGIFCIQGEMGAGKTTFIHSICRELGLDFAGSPTFSLVNEYITPEGISLFHFDLYRLKRLEEALDIGIDEYLAHDGYHLIEWPDVIESLIPENAQTVRIKDISGIREISF